MDPGYKISPQSMKLQKHLSLHHNDIIAPTSSGVGMNLSKRSQCSGSSPSKSVFRMNSTMVRALCPMRRFAITEGRGTKFRESHVCVCVCVCVCACMIVTVWMYHVNALWMHVSPRFLALLLSMRQSCSDSFFRAACKKSSSKLALYSVKCILNLLSKH